MKIRCMALVATIISMGITAGITILLGNGMEFYTSTLVAICLYHSIVAGNNKKD